MTSEDTETNWLRRDGFEADASVNDHELHVEKRLYSLDETLEILGGISMGTLYNLRKKGLLRIVKLGRRSLVDRREIERLIAGLPHK